MSAGTAVLLKELAEFDSPTICNAIELWGIRPQTEGYFNDSIQACFPQFPPMVGYAVTSTFRSAAPPQSGDVYASLSKQLQSFGELPGPAVIVFQDIDEPTVSATFGEVMCTTYQSFGACGIVTSGAGRDLDQVEALGFPAFTNGTICSHGYSHTVSVGVPVTVGGVTVHQGDLLHGDRNGVTTIPIEIASEVGDVARELMAAEQVILDYLQSTQSPTLAQLDEARDEHNRRLADLRKRLRG